MTVIGLEVPHAHIHLIPMNTIADMDFSQPRLVLDAIEMEEITQLIANQ
jgi:histidine triad (HIT) family protein